MKQQEQEFPLDEPRLDVIHLDNEDLENFSLHFEDFFYLGGIPVKSGRFLNLDISNDSEPIEKRYDELYTEKLEHIGVNTYRFKTITLDDVLALRVGQYANNLRIMIFWRPGVSTPMLDQKWFLRLFLVWLNDFYDIPLPAWAETELDMKTTDTSMSTSEAAHAIKHKSGRRSNPEYDAAFARIQAGERPANVEDALIAAWIQELGYPPDADAENRMRHAFKQAMSYRRQSQSGNQETNSIS